MSGKGRCCQSCAMFLIALGALAGIGVVLWKLVIPEDSKASIQDAFNNTLGGGIGVGGGSDGAGGTGLPDINIPDNPLGSGGTDLDQEGADSGYEFMQCTYSGDDNNNNCCNGLDSICDLRADEILYAGVHNAMAAKENGFILAPNHDLSLEKALEAGYRAINLDIAECDGDLLLIHGRCSFGSRDPTTVLTNLVEFMQENPSEVVLLNMQINNEASEQDVQLASIESLMKSVTGLTNLLYSHPDPSASWPTLRELIDADTRILFFHYNGATCGDACPAGFHDWFAFAAETEFSFNSVDAVQDTASSCVINRGKATSPFFGVNSFVTLSSRSASEQLNAYEAVRGHMEACSELNGNIDVNVIWVDFWAKGDLPRLTQVENQARAAGRRRTRRLRRKLIVWQ